MNTIIIMTVKHSITEEDNDGDYYNDGENDVRTCLSCKEFKANKHSHAYVKSGLCWDCYEESGKGFED